MPTLLEGLLQRGAELDSELVEESIDGLDDRIRGVSEGWWLEGEVSLVRTIIMRRNAPGELNNAHLHTRRGETYNARSGATSSSRSSRSSSIAVDSAVGAHLVKVEEIGLFVVEGKLESGLVELVEAIGLVVVEDKLDSGILELVVLLFGGLLVAGGRRLLVDGVAGGAGRGFTMLACHLVLIVIVIDLLHGLSRRWIVLP